MTIEIEDPKHTETKTFEETMEMAGGFGKF